MIEITAEDIAALRDEDLRALIGLLCEAELRQRNLPVASVTWGGDQAAKDGGVDVRLSLPHGTRIEGFVPKANTILQVKKQDMPRGEILDEMRPQGLVRPVIEELAKVSGAYVIVSSASTSDSALANRKAAMAEAIQDVDAAVDLTLDFYDANRVATWVRDRAGLIPWVRAKIGKPIKGWQGYGHWSPTPAGADASYLYDNEARIKSSKDDADGLSAVDGINKIRDSLRTAGSIVRLVGLSGVGKTRLAEALFEPGVGTNNLDPSLAFYTDIGFEPDPQPVGLASDLNANHTRAILVIDNCPPDVHRRVSDVVGSAGSTVSAITIEYDIQEDQPEGTDVFVLDTSSVSLIEKLVATRYRALSQVDSRTIAEFSGGNARIAFALARTIKNTETVTGLNDAELFRRLFEQRHASDASLLAIAQACSLVYSFEGTKLTGDDAELPILGALIGKSSSDVFAAVAELRRRDLLQSRGPWRAILPHAIANRLARTALENIPVETLMSAFGTHPRLLRSLSRRLGYLDGSAEARAIVQDWLREGGLLSSVIDFSEVGRAMFNNVAPVMPAAALSALESALASADDTVLKRCIHFVPLVRSIAYDKALFERAARLLVKFARLPVEGRSNRSAAEVLQSLFQIMLSGTHAALELRLSVIADLIASDDSATRELGAAALRASLKTAHFVTPHGFEFGSRSRDYGYHPQSRQDVHAWFGAVLEFSERTALSDEPAARSVRTSIADEFRGLWTDSGQQDRLERLSRAIAERGFWREGWLAVRQTRISNGSHLSPAALSRLQALEEVLRPKDLISKVRGLVIGSNRRGYEFDVLDDAKERDYASAAARFAAAVEELGHDLAFDDEAFETVLPELLSGDGQFVGCGEGIASTVENPREVWTAIVAQLAAIANPNPALLAGFLRGLQKRDQSLASSLLDDAVDAAPLATLFPYLQANVAVDQPALDRLHRSLSLAVAPIYQFRYLAWGRTSDVIPDSEFKRLVLTIGAKPDGMSIALEILAMRLHTDQNAKTSAQPEVVEAGKALLAIYVFREDDGHDEDYNVGTITRSTLVDEDCAAIVRRLCGDLKTAVAEYKTHAHDHAELVKGLFHVHPTVVLDELFSGDEASQRSGWHLLNTLAEFRQSPMETLPDDTLLRWCEREPAARYTLAAAVGWVFRRSTENAPYEWTELTRELLQRAPDPAAVLKVIGNRLIPTSGWSGSLATKLESRLKLFEQIDISALPAAGTAFAEAKEALKRRIEQERHFEQQFDRAHGGTFE